MKTYEITMRFKIKDDTELLTRDVDEMLSGSWFYDDDFQGVITKLRLKEIKRKKVPK